MEQVAPVAFQVTMGIGLAAVTGLRTFLPMFVVALAGKLDWLPLSERFEWLGTWPAVIVFGVAVVVELLADKVPVVDHVLDMLQVWVKPVAGAILATAVLTDLAPLEATALGIIAGGSTAGLIHLAKAKVRLLSTVVTSGIANPILSLIEDLAALVGAIAAITVPFLLAAAIVLCVVLLIVFIRRASLRARRA